MRLYLCVLILVLAGAVLHSQINPLEFPSEPPVTPTPDIELLSQAKLSQARGDHALAESQFQTLSRLQPFLLEAREGLLDAYLAQGKYRSVLRETKSIDRLKLSFNTHNYRAYALLKLGRYPEARHQYHIALSESGRGLVIPSISWQGLAFSYKALGDYPSYSRYQQLASGPEDLDNFSFSSTLAYKIPGKNKQALGFTQSAAFRSWSVDLAYENFFLDDDAFRQVYSLELGKQVRLIDIQLQARALEGEDARIYPARQAAARLNPRIYLNGLVLRPDVSLSYSHYPRFDVQQISFSPLVLLRDLDLSYTLNAVWLDHEAVGADSLHVSQQLSLGKKLPWGFYSSIQTGLGNDCWALDTTGNLIDTFNQAGDYYGASLSKLFRNQVLLTAYWQKWESDHLLYFSLKVFY